MRVLNYLELEDHLGPSGIRTAVNQQRSALATTDVEIATSPWSGGRLPAAARSKLGGDRFFGSYDLVHTNTVGPGSVAVAKYAQRNDLPLVLHAHVTREDFRESFRGSNLFSVVLGRYLRWFYSQADLVICPSEYTKRILRTYPVTAPIRPMTNGVDLEGLEGYDDLREQTRETYDLEGTVVFAVGHVFERKGLTTFCELAIESDYEFAWFGPYSTGPQASPTVRKWVTDPPENVTFTGWIEDRRAAFGAGDVYLFPSKAENQGIAVLEAMATRNAVILRDLPVFREYFEDGHDCLMCETHAEFRDALDRVTSDPDLRERLGRNARETAEQHSLDRLGESLQETYRELLEEG